MSSPSVSISVSFTDSLVAPGSVDSSLAAYWRRAEQWVSEYIAELPEPVDALGLMALEAFCGWAPFEAGWNTEWANWSRKLDADTFSRIDGAQMVSRGIAPFFGGNPEDVVHTMHDFAAFLGESDYVPAAQAERVCVEIMAAKADFVANFPATIEEAMGEDPLEAAVAPFMHWLLGTTSFSLDRRLLGQSLAMTALEQLDAQDMSQASWSRLKMTDCIAQAFDRTFMLVLQESDYTLLANALLNYLVGRRLISSKERARLRKGIAVPSFDAAC